jgi:23S rRNA-/tRNA-specific pseudouridylate synthase
MLHAFQLAFIHPRSGKRLKFEAPHPAEFDDVLKALR